MLRTASILLVLLLVGATTADARHRHSTLHPPIPSALKTSNKQQQITATQNQPATEDKRGTPSTPLIIEMTNPPNGNAIATEIKKNREDQSTQEWHSIVFNCLLVAVGLLQGAALIYTALVTNKAANAAKSAAEALPSVERAYVFLFHELRHRQTPNPLGGTALNVEFSLKNHGKTPAILRHISVDIRITDRPEYPTEFRAAAMADDMPPGFILGAGEQTPFFRRPYLITDAEWPEIRHRNHLLLFLGIVRYEDVFGKPHETGFCLDWDGQGFSPSNTEILNYHN